MRKGMCLGALPRTSVGTRPGQLSSQAARVHSCHRNAVVGHIGSGDAVVGCVGCQLSADAATNNTDIKLGRGTLPRVASYAFGYCLVVLPRT
jgi:hypothetical protein